MFICSFRKKVTVVKGDGLCIGVSWLNILMVCFLIEGADQGIVRLANRPMWPNDIKRRSLFMCVHARKRTIVAWRICYCSLLCVSTHERRHCSATSVHCLPWFCCDWVKKHSRWQPANYLNKVTFPRHVILEKYGVASVLELWFGTERYWVTGHCMLP